MVVLSQARSVSMCEYGLGRELGFSLAWQVGAAGLASVILPTAVAQTVTTAPVPSLVGAFSTALCDVPDNPRDDRLFALELTGKLRIVHRTDPGPLATPVLDISSQVPNFGDENGALGLALHPQFSTNGYVYIFHSRNNMGPAVVRYTAPISGIAPIDPGSRVIIMELPTFSSIHISGCLQFGPDGNLYISHGDNGASGNAQDPNTPRGKILRIDVDGDDFPGDPNRNYAIPQANFFSMPTGLERPEIWSIGVRNAWRFSFDRETGEIYIGDVGDSTREEVSRVPAAAWQNPGGLNFGWPCFEGTVPTAATCDFSEFPYQAPLRDFTRAEMQCIVGGFVYRGCAVPALQGRYLYANCFSFNQVRSLDPDNIGAIPIAHPIGPDLAGQISALAQDRDGELFLLGGAGVFRVTGLGTAFADCNANTLSDDCEIEAGVETDLNNDSIPDSCTRLCPADVNGDASVSVQDIFDFLSIWFSAIPAADFNASGDVSVQDIFDFLGAWFAGC